MIPLFGNFTLWLCLFLAAIQFLYSYKKNIYSIHQIYKITSNGLLFASLASFFSLMYSHVISDFSVINVFENSHTTKPLIYKISGVWGNHEGSMLLWILVLTIFNYFIFKSHNSKNNIFILHTLKIQSFIIFGFVLFTILTSNPFERMFPVKENGLGFNPILQDPALAIHPPLLYIGYVGLSAAFSMSIAALSISNNNNKINWYII